MTDAPVRERIERIDRALALWRDPDSPWRRRLAEQHGGYSPQVIDLGVTRGLAHWTRDVLAALRARELAQPCRVPSTTAVWLAGSVPTATFAALLLPVLAGSEVRAKPASADAVTPSLLAGSLAEAGLPDAIEIAGGEQALRDVDCVVAYGRDETVELIRRRLPPHTIFVGYGHKLSVAAIGAHARPERAAGELALDLALWDGRGCLSPAYVLVQDAPAGRAEALAAALADALERCERELPRAKLDPAEEAGIREWRAAVALEPDGRLWMPESTAWTVALERRSSLPSPGALRFARVVPFGDLDELAERCLGLSPHLSCVGQSGFGERVAQLEAIAASAGASRVCPLGRMQLPPIDWNHDGLSPLRPMLRLTDVERDESRGRA